MDIERLLEFKKWRNTPVSSNVKKIMYNDESKDLVIQFWRHNEIYTYFNVDFQTFLDISGGNAVCLTSGKSKWGSWYEGKSPSVGAAVHKFLVNKGVSYVKGGTLR